jgi:hypothetical protein
MNEKTVAAENPDPKNVAEEKPERRGWWWSPNSRKAHYFRESIGGRAICGGFLVFATGILFHEAQDNAHASPDNCAACKRKRKALVEKGQLPA